MFGPKVKNDSGMMLLQKAKRGALGGLPLDLALDGGLVLAKVPWVSRRRRPAPSFPPTVHAHVAVLPL